MVDILKQFDILPTLKQDEDSYGAQATYAWVTLKRQRFVIDKTYPVYWLGRWIIRASKKNYGVEPCGHQAILLQVAVVHLLLLSELILNSSVYLINLNHAGLHHRPEGPGFTPWVIN